MRVLALLALPLLLPACADRGAHPDCLLVVVDTLRADALSCYGGEPGTTPALDAFAAGAARFEECLAQAPNTATSHATLFTALHPWAHRVANLTSLEDGTPGLPPAFETLAERFAEAGYRTAAFTDGGPLGRSWNLCQGFERLEADYEGAAVKVDRALAFLDGPSDGRPTFLFVHTYEVHLPYAPPAELVERFDPGYDGPLRAAVAEVRATRARGELVTDGRRMLRERASFTERDWAHLRALYRAGVAQTDAELRRLLGRVGPDWVVAVTSDHGEELGEHGEVGHVALHRETLRVPLLLRLPEARRGRGGLGAGAVVADPVGLIDLHPTLLEACGLAPRPWQEASGSRSLLPLLRGERTAPRDLHAETTEHLYAARPTPWRRSVRFGDVAVLVLRPPGEGAHDAVSVHDLRRDPGETLDLLDADADRARVLAAEGLARIERHLQQQVELRLELVGGQPTVHAIRPDEDLAAELRALGYGGE